MLGLQLNARIERRISNWTYQIFRIKMADGAVSSSRNSVQVVEGQKKPKSRGHRRQNKPSKIDDQKGTYC